MQLLGLIPEPPFAPRSWSGSSAHFFRALDRAGLLSNACQVSGSSLSDAWQKARVFNWRIARWRERYNSSVPRFLSLTRAAARCVSANPGAHGILQVGAWFSAPMTTSLPCFSYHDGNAALWYRYYGRGLLAERKIQNHLRWERENYARMRAVFVMSQWLASSFIDDFGVAPDKVHVVGAGINFDRLPAASPRDFGTARFLLVGRDFERKGGRYLLEAFRKARGVVPQCELTIVGPEPGPAEPGVRYCGFLSKDNPDHQAELDRIFRTSTVMMLPSVYEPFGISLLEGMSHGLACITVNRCALPEIVSHNETGLVASPEDPDSLAEAMITLARNPELTRQMGEAGRLRVQEHFTWDVVARKIRRALEQ